MELHQELMTDKLRREMETMRAQYEAERAEHISHIVNLTKLLKDANEALRLNRLPDGGRGSKSSNGHQP